MKIYFAENLRYLRKVNNITQSALSAMMKKKHTTIGNWEKKISRPNIEELVELANYFNLSVDDILLKDCTNIKGNKKFVKEDAIPESSLPRNTDVIYTDKLIESLQLNVQSLQQIVAFKTEELQQLREEKIFLKQTSKGNKLKVVQD